MVEKGCLMSRVENIISQIGELSSAELAAFREWFAKFDASAWDRQFEADVEAGKFDSLAEQALDGTSGLGVRADRRTSTGRALARY
jgi:hypothetical protein